MNRDDEVARLTAAVATVQDFPEPGIAFKDLSPVLADPGLFASAMRLVTDAAMDLARDRRIDAFAGVDSRGFLFASAAAQLAQVGCLLVRKEGKLPEPTLSAPASTEYSDVGLCLNPELFAGRQVVLLDDIMATGGTAIAAANLAREAGAEVLAAVFLGEITFLEGCERFTKDTGIPATAVLQL